MPMCPSCKVSSFNLHPQTCFPVDTICNNKKNPAIKRHNVAHDDIKREMGEEKEEEGKEDDEE